MLRIMTNVFYVERKTEHQRGKRSLSKKLPTRWIRHLCFKPPLSPLPTFPPRQKLTSRTFSYSDSNFVCHLQICWTDKMRSDVDDCLIAGIKLHSIIDDHRNGRFFYGKMNKSHWAPFSQLDIVHGTTTKMKSFHKQQERFPDITTKQESHEATSLNWGIVDTVTDEISPCREGEKFLVFSGRRPAP